MRRLCASEPRARRRPPRRRGRARLRARPDPHVGRAAAVRASTSAASARRSSARRSSRASPRRREEAIARAGVGRDPRRRLPRLRLRRLAGRRLHRLDAGVRGREPRRSATPRSATSTRARSGGGSTTAATTTASTSGSSTSTSVLGAGRRRGGARARRHRAEADHAPRAADGRRAALPQRRRDDAVRGARSRCRCSTSRREDRPACDALYEAFAGQRLPLPAAVDGGVQGGLRRRARHRGLERRDGDDVLAARGSRSASPASATRWFRGPHAAVDGEAVRGPHRGRDHVDGRRALITETAGLGGFAQAAALPLQRYQGGTAQAHDRPQPRAVRHLRRRAHGVQDPALRLPRHADRHRRPRRWWRPGSCPRWTSASAAATAGRSAPASSARRWSASSSPALAYAARYGGLTARDEHRCARRCACASTCAVIAAAGAVGVAGDDRVVELGVHQVRARLEPARRRRRSAGTCPRGPPRSRLERRPLRDDPRDQQVVLAVGAHPVGDGALGAAWRRAPSSHSKASSSAARSVFVRRCAARRAAIGSTASRNSMISSNSRSRAPQLRRGRSDCGRTEMPPDEPRGSRPAPRPPARAPPRAPWCARRRASCASSRSGGSLSPAPKWPRWIERRSCSSTSSCAGIAATGPSERASATTASGRG